MSERFAQTDFAAPRAATELLLVRHAQSAPLGLDPDELNADGYADPSLTPAGRAQAERAAGRLVQQRIDAIYVSPLRRTAETAAPLAALLGLDPRVEPDLREVHLGAWEGGLFRKFDAERHPLARTLWREERWEVIPDAEPSEAFSARVRAALERIVAAHPGQRVAVFSHGGVIGHALALASDSRPFVFIHADNASISQLVVTPRRWLVRRFNDTAHLENQPMRRR
jgi:2,3-bisphosphoglycerate-dependent phosphoglycerate mutase